VIFSTFAAAVFSKTLERPTVVGNMSLHSKIHDNGISVKCCKQYTLAHGLEANPMSKKQEKRFNTETIYINTTDKLPNTVRSD